MSVSTTFVLLLLVIVGTYQAKAGFPRVFGDYYLEAVLGDFQIFKALMLSSATLLTFAQLLKIIETTKI